MKHKWILKDADYEMFHIDILMYFHNSNNETFVNI